VKSSIQICPGQAPALEVQVAQRFAEQENGSAQVVNAAYTYEHRQKHIALLLPSKCVCEAKRISRNRHVSHADPAEHSPQTSRRGVSPAKATSSWRFSPG